MNFKTTYILFGLLGLMLAVLGYVLYSGPSASPGEGFVFPSMRAKDKELKPDDVDKIVVVRKRSGEPDIVFERVDATTWKIVSPAETPADSRLLVGLVDQIRSAEIEKEGTVPSASKAGLDDPTRIITLHSKARLWALKVGDSTPGKQGAIVYVTSSDRPGKVLAVPKSALESALEGYEYYRAKELLGDNATDIRAVKFTQGKKPPVELTKDKERWVMSQPPYGDIEIGQLLELLTNLRVEHKDAKTTDFVKDGVTDLAEYNLDAGKEVLRIDITRGEGDKKSTKSILVGTSKKVNEKSYYAALDADAKAKDIVKVSADSVAPILKWVEDPGAFRSKNLLALEAFRQPDAIVIKNSFGDLEFFRAEEKDPWQLYRGTSANNVDPLEVRKLVDELNKKGAVVSFLDPKRRKELGLEKPDVTVRIYAESLEKPDAKKPGKPALKKDAKPAAELRFGLAEGANVAVERVWGNDSTLVMVPMSLLDQVRKGPMAYFDRSIPSFNPGSAEEGVTKVELTRDGQTFVVTRSAPTEPWKIEQPAALKGRTADAQAVRSMLGELNRLTAREIVAEKADAKDLAAYNLLKPPVKVVVTLTKDGKPVPTTFDFGNEAGARGVYLKVGGKDAVYLVGNETLLPLKKELRDTAVFAFDPSKVTGVTVTGWKSQLGAAESLTFEQKDGTWTAKVPPTYPVDPAKVAAFVADLSRLRLERFVTTGKGLTLAEDALQVEVTLADKTVLELMVGAADGAGYFATSKQHPGDTFVVGKALFEEVRKGKGSFAKK
jgi:hypothetical protein